MKEKIAILKKSLGKPLKITKIAFVHSDFLFLDRLANPKSCYVCLMKRWDSPIIHSLYRCKFHISVCRSYFFSV